MNPFEIDVTGSGAVTVRPSTNNALVDVETQRAISEVQGAIVLAKKFPRNQKEACDRILNACQRVSLAKDAVYTYSRGGTSVSGPSIRLAEAIAQNWGNLQFGIVEMEQRQGESTVKAYAWDVETNTKQEKVFQVAHIRYTKQGTKQLSDPRDIYELVANQGARRLRACILSVIPGDVIDAAVDECDKTLKTKIDVTPEAVHKLVEAFAAFGVSKAQIEARIQRRIEAIEPGQVVQMRKIYTSLKDSMSTPEDWFEPVDSESGGKSSEKGANGLKGRLKNNVSPKTKDDAPPPESTAELPITAEELAEVTQAQGQQPPSDTAELLQTVYKAITDLATECGEMPDDMLYTLANGRLSALIDLEGKSEPYLNDILMMVQAKAKPE